MGKQMLSIGESANLIGVSPSTLRRWEREGRLASAARTVGNHRRYSFDTLQKLFLRTSVKDQLVVGYARVSSHDQKEDLIRQESVLRQELSKYTGATEIISDLGSGMNFKKRGLQRLLRLLISGKVRTLVLTHKDRLLRFGSDLIFQLCDHFGTEVVVLGYQEQSLTTEQMFAADVIELITVFSARLYGKRSHNNKRKALSAAAA